MDRVKIGVIGVGRMGRNHCRVYSNLRRAELVGVTDAMPEVGRQVAQQYDVPFYNQLDDLLDKVDAVSLVTPTPLHFDLAKRCIERGVHVLIEKPITETLEQAETLTQMAEMSGLVIQVGHIERFNSAYVELKNVLKDMTILAVNMRRLSAYESSNKDVNVVLDLMIHDIDLALDLIDQPPVSINAHGLTTLSNVVDHASVQMSFQAGPLLTMTSSRVTEHKIRTIEVTALEAFLECDLLDKNIYVHRRTKGEFQNHNSRGFKYRQESIVERIHVPVFEPLFLELQHFVDCIVDNQPPQVSARDGLQALRMATLIQDHIDDHLLHIDASGSEMAMNKNGVPISG